MRAGLMAHFLRCACAALLLTEIPLVLAEGPAGPLFEPEVVDAPVVVWHREITELRASYEQYSPADRAKRVVELILAIPDGQAEYHVVAKDAMLGARAGAWILINGNPVFGVFQNDANAQVGESFEQYKATTIANLQARLEVREQQHRWPLLLRGLAFALLATLAYDGIGMLILRSSRWLIRGKRTAGLARYRFVVR